MIENINPTDKIVVDVSMYQIDLNTSKLQSLRKEVAEKYNLPLRNVYINPKPIMVDEDGKAVSLTSDIITSIQDPKFQQNLFKEYVELKKLENVDMDMILDIDNKVNAFVDFDSYSKYKSYKFKYVKWKNFLSYGEDNYIDFTKLMDWFFYVVILRTKVERRHWQEIFFVLLCLDVQRKLLIFQACLMNIFLKQLKCVSR